MKNPSLYAVNDGLIVTISPPDEPVSPMGAPMIDLTIESIKFDSHHIDNLYWNQTVTRTGIYLADNPEEIIENQAIFYAEHAAALLDGEYAADGWFSYGLTATPTTLRIDYYYVHDPQRRGMIELGRNFNQLSAKILIAYNWSHACLKRNGHVISEWKHHTCSEYAYMPEWELYFLRTISSEPRFFGLMQRKYTDGMLTAKYLTEDDAISDTCTLVLTSKDYDPAHRIDNITKISV